MRFFLAEGHDVVAFPEPVFGRLRAMVPQEYEIVVAHQRVNGALIAWCRKRNGDDLFQFAEGVVASGTEQ